MPDQKKTTRSAPISYRPPVELRGELYARQLRSGLSMNAFITKSIFDAPILRQSRRSPVEKGDLAHLLNHAAQIRERLFEIAPSDSDASGDPLEAALAELAIIRSALIKMLGRTP
jgi:hypothetical protein